MADPTVADGHRFLTFDVVAERRGTTRRTAYRDVEAGRLPAPYDAGPNRRRFSNFEIEAVELNMPRVTYGSPEPESVPA